MTADMVYINEDALDIAWLVVGGLALIWAINHISSSSASWESGPGAPYDRVTLSETALERLERGETIEIERWHGKELSIAEAPILEQ